jgi:hypothetical protein
MEAYGIYCLKTGLILLLFLGIYGVCLRKETFYRFNRFFLLAGLFTALLLPLVTIRYRVEINASGSMAVSRPVTEAAQAVLSAAENNRLRPFLLSLCDQWLPVIYLTGLCAFLAIRLAGLSHLLGYIRKNGRRKFSHYRLIESADFKGAFSFFHFIFMPAHLNDPEKKLILKHEEAHILQKHWIDLLCLHFLSLVWWFNPLLRLYGNMIRTNHEYLADRAVLVDYGQAFYQEVLVNQCFNLSVFPFAHSFSYTNPLKRIYMMKKNNSNPLKKHLSWLVLPPLVALLWVFAEPEYVRAESRGVRPDDPVTTRSVSDRNVHRPGVRLRAGDESVLTADTITIGFGSGERLADGLFEQDTLPVVTAQKEAAATAGVTFVKTGAATIHGTKASPLLIINGKKSDRKIEELDPASILSVSVRKNAVEAYGREAENGVIEIITKPARLTVSRHAIGTGEKESDVVVLSGDSISIIDCDAIYLSKIKEEPTANPLIIVDGERPMQDLNSILRKPGDILSLTVLKNKPATDLYGETGKNGVILIKTKKGSQTK